ELTTIPDFDVELTGFDTPDIDALLADLMDQRGADADDDFDAADGLRPDEPAITQPGDLIELGPHRLLCGDCSKAEDVDRLLDGNPIDLVFTDPPYNVDYYGGNRPKPQGARPKQSREWKRIYADNQSQEKYEAWFGRVVANFKTHLRPSTPIYIWNGHRQFGPMHSMLSAAGIQVACVITWAKECFAIGYGDYQQQTEFCLYGWLADKKGGHAWYGPNNASTLWQVHRDRTRDYRHPTQKPLELAERAIRNSSKRDDVVFDGFLGSGTTLIAAERLGRRCFGTEIDPHYCDGIVRRYLACVGADQAAPELVKKYQLDSEVSA
ncbi:MAG TPA: site-specific DNA-methyltransferase, partial [Phycisphaerae bacterium]|nr:site-specific DNA-methyltransferase [Phycisphaerae bacterium]